MNDFVYCPHCATPLEQAAVFNQIRPRCPDCGFIHFRDPKVAVIAFVTYNDRLLLICRAVEPAKGLWALPGGYMDADEMPREALRRELEEEVGLDVNVGRLLDIFPMEDPATTSHKERRGIVLAFEAEPANDDLITLQSMDDVSAAGWFAVDELPAEIAFASTETLVTAWKRRA